MQPDQQAPPLTDGTLGQPPPLRRQRRGCLVNLFRLLAAGLFGMAVLYGVVGITAPWSFHIGGRWTPLLIWQGYGQLVTKGGTKYPLYVSFYPSSHFSHLHREGLSPTGGLQGSGWICTSPRVTERLRLSGTIYGGWRSTDGSLMAFRLLERKIIDVGQGQGFFDLAGRWQGHELVMNDNGHPPKPFRSGLRIEHASIVLGWGSYSEFEGLCAHMASYRARP